MSYIPSAQEWAAFFPLASSSEKPPSGREMAMISARSSVWLRSAGPGGCWWKSDGPLALHILASCLAIGIGNGEKRQYSMFDLVGQLDAVYVGEVDTISNAIFQLSATALHDAMFSKWTHWLLPLWSSHATYPRSRSSILQGPSPL